MQAHRFSCTPLLRMLLLAAVCCFSHEALARVRLGIDVLAADDYALLKGKRVGLITNQTGVSSSGTKTRVLLKKNVNLVALFAPEHGIDGTIGAGKYVSSRKDSITGVTIHSLYGPTRKPTPAMLKGIDTLVYDMQDIGVRSYTYISTMVRAMEAAGENNVEFVVLDRPNPLGGQRVEGPMIEEKWRSFVGQIPVPYVHGMTAGELAQMTNAKGWNAARCNLKVVSMSGWNRGMMWRDTGLSWVRTSPNIPRADSPAYYVAGGIIGSLTGVALEIGTNKGFPFEAVGTPGLNADTFTAQMKDRVPNGISFSPFHYDGCHGTRLGISPGTSANLTGLAVHLLAQVHQSTRGGVFSKYRDPDQIFYKVYGSTSIRTQLEGGVSAHKIIAGWDGHISRFKGDRKGYLLY